jgi:hypothetical protein
VVRATAALTLEKAGFALHLAGEVISETGGQA